MRGRFGKDERDPPLLGVEQHKERVADDGVSESRFVSYRTSVMRSVSPGFMPRSGSTTSIMLCQANNAVRYFADCSFFLLTKECISVY